MKRRRVISTGPTRPRIENKYFDTTLNTAAQNPWFVVRSLNQVPQGVTANERIGRAITINRVSVRYRISRDDELSVAAPLAPLRPMTGILLIVLDKQANGLLPAPADIFQAPLEDTSFNNLTNSNRFQTLIRKTFTVPQGNLSNDADTVNYTMSGGITRVMTVTKDCRIRVDFNGTFGAVDELTSANLVQVVYFTHEDAGTLVGTCRIRYTDC